MMDKYKWQTEIALAADNPTVVRISVLFANYYRNEETGQLDPATETLAKVLGVSRQSVNRAIRWLTDHGFLARSEARGGGKLSYTLLFDGKEIPLTKGSDGKVIPFRKSAQGSISRKNGAPKCSNQAAKKLRSEHSYNKDESLKEPLRAREAGECPVDRIEVAHLGGHRAEAWDEWLGRSGWPSLSELGQRASDANGAGWRVPSPMPPKDRESIGWTIAEKYFAWAAARLEDRRQGVA